MKDVLKSSLLAFLAGGVIGVAMQGLYMILFAIISDVFLSIMLTLFILAGLGAVLTAVGVFFKLDKLFGLGVNAPVCGLGFAIAAPAIESRAEGKSMGKSIWSAVVVALSIFGTAAAFALIAALIRFFLVDR